MSGYLRELPGDFALVMSLTATGAAGTWGQPQTIRDGSRNTSADRRANGPNLHRVVTILIPRTGGDWVVRYINDKERGKKGAIQVELSDLN